MREFDAVIEAAPRGGAWVDVPFDVKDVFGSGRPKIVATFDGVPYRGSVASMGGQYVLGVRKDIRAEIGKGPGDRVRVTIELDSAPRTVEVPDDLARALAESDRRAGFDALSYTKRRELVGSIESAKRPETRRRRVLKAVEELA